MNKQTKIKIMEMIVSDKFHLLKEKNESTIDYVLKQEFYKEKIKYDKNGSCIDYFLGADPKKTKYYKTYKKK